jgi:hypothetical protein
MENTKNILKNPVFDGADYIPEFDNKRLTGQIKTIYFLMIDGSWRTLRDIESLTGYGQASISAQLRNLRKDRFGNHEILKRYKGDRKLGLFEYKLIIKE